MHCLSCGTVIEPVLSYCHQCGAKIKVTENKIEKLSKPTLDLLIAAIMIIPTAGLGILVALINDTKEAGFSDIFILALTGLSILILLVAELALVGLLQTYTRVFKEKAEDDRGETKTSAPQSRKKIILDFSRRGKLFAEPSRRRMEPFRKT